MKYCPAVLLALLTIAPAALAQDAPVPQVQTSGSLPRWTVQAGLGSTRAWNLVGVSVDLARFEHVSVYLSGGMGTILAGAGVAYFSNRRGNGVVLSATAGLVGAHVNAGYQFNLGRGSFLVGGASLGYFFCSTRAFYLLWGMNSDFREGARPRSFDPAIRSRPRTRQKKN